ncbi:aldo/keto reductase [Phytoactinopolyspora limicola]|uniref:aldo/keto reductase n=1 Tax=Phytoactinopolyspora limicola TaxID=2715536 RepID=UPI001A9C7AA1|nr:aldo/keto reductase [Phytoactinopolyspora limicola]
MNEPTVNMPLRTFGSTSLEVTEIGFGTSALASMPAAFGYAVPERRAIDTILEILRGPVNLIDTAAEYGDGSGERRIGTAISEYGGIPKRFVLATKVDRDKYTGDFSGSQIRKSLEGSLKRLGLDRFPLLYLHDPEHISFSEATSPRGPVKELIRIHDEGLADYIGVAGGPVGLLTRYIHTGIFHAVLTHNRWTLLDRSANDLINTANSAGLAVVNAAPFGGGLLARGASRSASYAYRHAHPVVLDRVRAIQDACLAHQVPLAAAAVQFSTRDARISSTLIGVSQPERIRNTLRLAHWPIPEELWETLERSAAPQEYWQD